jgi:hypothetical protein
MHWHIYTFNGKIGVVESRITSGFSLIEFKYFFFSFPGGGDQSLKLGRNREENKQPLATTSYRERESLEMDS